MSGLANDSCHIAIQFPSRSTDSLEFRLALNTSFNHYDKVTLQFVLVLV